MVATRCCVLYRRRGVGLGWRDDGALIHRFSLPPFLVTLAGMFFARGAAFLVSMQPIGIDRRVDLPTPKSGLGSS
ncbi:hypothetical protein [Sorangium sp. So ce1099]|uniref:hypothetical protein n=1 Tax=Sorangium sp. So ce1099 TaxID=3133331 RepID=UPI003F62A1A5